METKADEIEKINNKVSIGELIEINVNKIQQLMAVTPEYINQIIKICGRDINNKCQKEFELLYINTQDIIKFCKKSLDYFKELDEDDFNKMKINIIEILNKHNEFIEYLDNMKQIVYSN